MCLCKNSMFEKWFGKEKSYFMHCKWFDFDAVENWILMWLKTLCKIQTLDCQNVKPSLKASCETWMIFFFMPNMCYAECVHLVSVDACSICLLQLDFIFFLTVSWRISFGRVLTCKVLFLSSSWVNFSWRKICPSLGWVVRVLSSLNHMNSIFRQKNFCPSLVWQLCLFSVLH